MDPRRRVLIAHPYAGDIGGGNVVAAWALEALCRDFRVTLATLGPVDHAALNRSFGTTLRPGDFEICIAPPRYLRLLRYMPTQGALLEAAVTTRWARRLDSQQPFDVLLSTQNEMDFGRPGVQYVHYPWAHLPRPDIEMRWFHRIPGVLAAYRGFCLSVSRGTREGQRRNLSLANSAFVAAKIKEVYGVEALVLHPPVPGNFPEVPWERKRAAAVAVGRMHPVKRWEVVVDIVDRVRAKGLDLGLTLINQPAIPAYAQRIESLAATRPWFRILTGLTRDQLGQELAGHRYGLHAMENEHFGIAVAEMMRAGCLPFVHDSGGPVEIVGGRRELRFSDAGEGAERLAGVMRDGELEAELRRFTAARQNIFSAEAFCQQLFRAISQKIMLSF